MSSRLNHLHRAIVRWRVWKAITPVRVIGVGLLALAAYMTLHKYGFDWAHILDTFYDAIIAALFSVVFTVLVIDLLNERRANRDRKRAIIEQMGSQVNDAALEAVRIARKEGWLEDGSLSAANLELANLQGAGLGMANLQEVDLSCANLGGAYLENAIAQRANLSNANLQSALMRWANLQGANLEYAKLQGAWLIYANLEGANMIEAMFDKETVLPDKTQWNRRTDMARFTDPNHPDFWRPDDQELLDRWKRENSEGTKASE